MPIFKEESTSVLSNLAKNFGPEITRSFHIFPVYRIEKLRNTRNRYTVSRLMQI